MKKIWFLTTLLICWLLLTGCDHLKEWNDFYSLCEERAKNLNWESIFKWDWIIQSWDENILYWMRYSINKSWEFYSDESVQCTFDSKWNLKWVLKNWRVFTPNNIKNNELMESWWYLYRNLDLTNESDKQEYEKLQNNKNMILEYQTQTSISVNKFIDTIHDDLLKSCEQYWTGYETMKWTMYERDVCVDNYISELYKKLKSELNSPRFIYLWDDPILLSYYNDLNWNHPFVRYFVDIYEYISNKSYNLEWQMPKRSFWPALSEIPGNENNVADWESFERKLMTNWTWFYTNWEWNITEIENWFYISSIDYWVVFNWNMLTRIQEKYWYNFQYWNSDIRQWSAPMKWPFVLHYNDWYTDYVYQIYREWWGSWEFYLLVWKLKDWLRIPIWECWYLLYPNYPVLFGECKNWQNFDPLTIFTQEYNLYKYNEINDMVNNFRFFLKYLESIRILAK